MKRYLITGAGRGIGKAIALELARPDAHLLLHGRNRQALEETAGEVRKKGAEALCLICDLTDATAIERMIAGIGSEPLDALVNNAGIAVIKPLEQLTIEEWNRTVAVNITAPFLFTQKLLPIMPAGASIVNILSVAAKIGFADWSSYCMSKFALEGFSLSIREELRARGIRVINIYPAASDTRLWEQIPGDWPRSQMMPAEQVAEAVSYALNRPASTLVENITLGNIGGNL